MPARFQRCACRIATGSSRTRGPKDRSNNSDVPAKTCGPSHVRGVPTMELLNPTRETTAGSEGLQNMASGSRRFGPICHIFGSATDQIPAMPLCEEIEFCRLVAYAVEKRKINSKCGAVARMALDGNLPSM